MMNAPGFLTRDPLPARRLTAGSFLALVLAASLGTAPPAAREDEAPPPDPRTPGAAAATQPAVPAEEAPSGPESVESSNPVPLPTDGEIRARVEEALSRDAAIAGHGSFQVTCEGGIVTIRGSAETLSIVRQAERRAGDIVGVLDVVIACSISTASVSDPTILLEVQRALDLPAFRGDRIAATVNDGLVDLSGTTATYARKLLAERSVSEVPGVVLVRNNLRVVAPPEGDDNALAWRIRLLLTGGLTPIPGRFDVTVKNREVVLRGEVPLYSHRIQAERLALSVGGIVAVENRLKVDPSLALPRLTPEGPP